MPCYDEKEQAGKDANNILPTEIDFKTCRINKRNEFLIKLRNDERFTKQYRFRTNLTKNSFLDVLHFFL